MYLNLMIGTKIKELRTSRHWTMDTLAEKSNVSKATICRIEKGGDACVSTIVLLCEVLDCTFEYLVKM